MEKIKELRDYFITGELRVHEDYVAFWGTVFSNWYDAGFDLDGIHWKTSEHYFIAQKALYFGDIDSYNRIIDAKTPADAKSIGREVKNFDSNKWMEVCKNIMHIAVYEKFNQNKELRDYILSDVFDDKHFVEGSPFDTIWGIGLKWNDKRIADKNNWKGLNLLGEVLDEVRDELKNEKL